MVSCFSDRAETFCGNNVFLPSEFMEVLLIPLIKNKTLTASESSNYRPIALPTAASKLFEIILQQKLSTYLYTSDSQFGFKAAHSTDMAVFSFKESVKIYLKSGSPVFVCFLDATKAFDRVNHKKLFDTLKMRGVPEYLIRILSYWYSNQKYAVKWGNAISSYFEVSNGIRQGGILSPILYNLYTDRLSTLLTRSRIGCHIAGECVNHVAYADDMVLLSPSWKALQLLIEICCEFASKNDIIYNDSKTKCMAFWPRSYRQAAIAPITLGTASIEFGDEAIYLGHHISHNLKDDSDIYKQIKKMNTVGNVLIRKMATCTDKVKCELFRAHCSALYCSSLWSSYNLSMYQKLKVCHNDILRRLLGIPRWNSARTMFVNTRLDHLDVIIRKQCYNFKRRMELSHNKMIRAIFDSCSFKLSKLFSKWRDNTEVV